MRRSAGSVALIGGLVLAAAGAGPLAAQQGTLEHIHRSESLLLGQLMKADAAGSDAWEINLAGQLAHTDEDSPGPGLDELGPRAAEIIVRGQNFQRDVLAALQTAHPRATVGYLVEEYRSRPEVALPTAPKNMDVLYDHDSAMAFRMRYPKLKGVLWSGRWFSLAVTEPLIDLLSGEARAAGIDTVTARYRAKLEGTEPPNTYPSELPLAPAIAPGLLWVSPEAAVIWDNHAFFVEVVADILSDPEVEDRRAAIEAAVDFFVDEDLAVTPQLMWETMALRHGIFFQGGYPLAVMTENERNVNSHGAHMQRGGPTVIPGMAGGGMGGGR